MRRHRLAARPGGAAAAVLAAVVLMGVTGCSGDDGADGAARPTESASASSGASSTTTTTPAAPVEPGKGGAAHAPSAAELGKTMLAAGQAAASVKLQVVASSSASDDETTASGSMLLTGGTAVQLSTGIGTETVKLRLVGEDAFVSTGQPINDKLWIRLDPSGTDRASQLFSGLVSALRGAVDLRASVASFEHASGFKALGPKTFDGVGTHGYRILLDEDALVAALPEEKRDDLKDQLAGADVRYTVYVDGEGLPRHAESVSTTSAGSSTQIIDYTGWGSAVTIEAPPADQVLEAAELG